jgi:hypothetical protein
VRRQRTRFQGQRSQADLRPSVSRTRSGADRRTTDTSSSHTEKPERTELPSASDLGGRGSSASTRRLSVRGVTVTGPLNRLDPRPAHAHLVSSAWQSRKPQCSSGAYGPRRLAIDVDDRGAVVTIEAVECDAQIASLVRHHESATADRASRPQARHLCGVDPEASGVLAGPTDRKPGVI